MLREPEVPEESPSGRMARLSCKGFLKGTCTTPFCEKWHPPECLFCKTENGWPGRWGPQGMSITGGGELARVPNLRVCKHLSVLVWHTQGGKDELTSTVVPSCRRGKNLHRKSRAASLSPTNPPTHQKKKDSGHHMARGRQSSPILEVRPGNRQVRWAAAHPGQDRRLPSVVTHSRL